MPSSRDTSAGTEIATPLMPESELSCETASAQAEALRLVMKTLEQPESKRAVAAWRPRPREPEMVGLSVRLRIGEKGLDHTAGDECDFLGSREEGRKGAC